METLVANLLPFDPQGWTPARVKVELFEIEEQFTQCSLLCNPANRYHGDFNAWYADESACYPYALGDKSLFIFRTCLSSNLGCLSAKPPINPTKQETYKTAMAEGLEPTGCKIKVKDGYRPVALLFREGLNPLEGIPLLIRDYHWVRLDKVEADSSGKPALVWSHKFRGILPWILRFQNQVPVLDLRAVSVSSISGRCDVDIDEEDQMTRSSRFGFVGFFNVPNSLSIPVSSINARIDVMRAQNASPGDINNWCEHLARVGIPRTGQVTIPQYG